MYRGQEGLGVRVARRVEYLFDGSRFHHRSPEEDNHPIGYVPHQSEIMADEQHGGLAHFLRLAQEINHRGLDRDVKRGYRFIRENQLRLSGKRPRDGDPLDLASGQ